MPKSSSLRKERHSENETIAINRKSHVSLSNMHHLEGTAHWMSIMRHFSEKHKEKCSVMSHVHQPIVQPKINRPTGSSYEGSWNVLGGMNGHGVYTFPNGVVYEGGFQDGEFDGLGELRYSSGVCVKGRWRKGEIIEQTIVFDESLEYEDQGWKYCSYPDRRFTIEHDNGIEPAGRSNLTANQPTRTVPPGYYDTGYGFYDAVNKTVYKYDNLLELIKVPQKRERIFIETSCRKGPDDSIGPCDILYEKWLTPTMNPERPPPPSVHTRTNVRKRESSLSFKGLFGRSTSRIRLSENNRISIRSCGGVREFYNKGNLTGGRLNGRSYSDQLLARASTASRTDKIVLDSINNLSSRSDSYLWNKTKKILVTDKSVKKPLYSALKGPHKQLINW